MPTGALHQREREYFSKEFSDVLPTFQTIELPYLPEISATSQSNFNSTSWLPGQDSAAEEARTAVRATRSVSEQQWHDENMAEVVRTGDITASCALEKHVFGSVTYEAENDSSLCTMSLEPRPIKDINGIKSFASTATQLCQLSETALSSKLTSSKNFETRFPIRRHNSTEQTQLLDKKYSCPFPSPISSKSTSIAVCQGVHDKLISKMISRTNHNKEMKSNKKRSQSNALPTQEDSNKRHCHFSTPNFPLLNEYCKGDHSPPPSPTSSLPKTQHDCTISMARDEDCNWLSEFQCLVRSDVLELFARTNHTTTTSMNQQKESPQEVVGIRCRFCAQQEVRARRSTAFPSDISKIYQSVSMMIRDHIPKCSSIPLSLQLRLKNLQNSAKQSALGVKHYWEYSASALGLIDTPNGLQFHNNCIKKKLSGSSSNSSSVDINQNSSTANNLSNQEMKAYIPPFGKAINDVGSTGMPLVTENDCLMSPPAFYFEVMKQVELVYLDPSEIRAYRRVLKLGHSGFGCIYCGEAGRMGFSRKFPITKKSLPSKIEEMSNHLIRCSLCPRPVQKHLRDLCCNKERLTPKMKEKKRAFMDLIWKRLWIDDKTRDDEPFWCI